MKTPPLILNCQRTEVMMSRLGKSGKPGLWWYLAHGDLSEVSLKFQDDEIGLDNELLKLSKKGGTKNEKDYLLDCNCVGGCFSGICCSTKKDD